MTVEKLNDLKLRIQECQNSLDLIGTAAGATSGAEFVRLSKEAHYLLNKYNLTDGYSRSGGYTCESGDDDLLELGEDLDGMAIDSKLINVKSGDMNTLKSFFPGLSFRLKLLYLGTQHGFTKEAFDQKVLGIQNTLVLVKTEFDQVCGGYTSIPWADVKSGVEFVDYQDDTAFLFNLTKGVHLGQRNKTSTNVVCHYGEGYSVLFGFGFGHDLCIYENCTQHDESYSNLGYTFKTPETLKEYSDEAFSFLGGKQHFRVVEIECFQVIFFNQPSARQ